LNACDGISPLPPGFFARFLSRLDNQPYRGPHLVVDRYILEGRDADQIYFHAGLGKHVAGDGDRFDGLVYRARPYGVELRPPGFLYRPRERPRD